MIKVRRGNVSLRVPEEQVDRFVKEGYNAYDEQGNLLKRAIVSDPATLRAQQAEFEKTIKSLKGKIAELESQLAEVKADSEKLLESDATSEQIATLKQENKELKKRLRTAEKQLQQYE